MAITKKKATISIDIKMAQKIKEQNIKLSSLIHKLLKEYLEKNNVK